MTEGGTDGKNGQEKRQRHGEEILRQGNRGKIEKAQRDLALNTI